MQKREMSDEQHPRPAEMRRFGLVDLFALIAFFIPIFAAISGVNRQGGGSTRYLVTLPLSIGLGVLIVCVEWRIGKVIWWRFEHYSDKVKNAVGVFLFVIQLFWIFVGLMIGTRLGAFIVNQFAP